MDFDEPEDEQSTETTSAATTTTTATTADGTTTSEQPGAVETTPTPPIATAPQPEAPVPEGATEEATTPTTTTTSTTTTMSDGDTEEVQPTPVGAPTTNETTETAKTTMPDEITPPDFDNKTAQPTTSSWSEAMGTADAINDVDKTTTLAATPAATADLTYKRPASTGRRSHVRQRSTTPTSRKPTEVDNDYDNDPTKRKKLAPKLVTNYGGKHTI